MGALFAGILVGFLCWAIFLVAQQLLLFDVTRSPSSAIEDINEMRANVPSQRRSWRDDDQRSDGHGAHRRLFLCCPRHAQPSVLIADSPSTTLTHLILHM